MIGRPSAASALAAVSPTLGVRYSTAAEAQNALDANKCGHTSKLHIQRAQAVATGAALSKWMKGEGLIAELPLWTCRFSRSC